jgi:hypothetical protein
MKLFLLKDYDFVLFILYIYPCFAESANSFHGQLQNLLIFINYGIT